MDRRTFLAAAGAAALLKPKTASAAANVKFGVDLFSIRSQGWTPFQYLDYCAKWNVKVVHFSELRFIGSLEPDNLKRVRAHAAEVGIEVELGMRSICPTSTMFDPKQGTAEEQLTKAIEAAVIVGSPIVRCVLGSSADRTGKLPIEAHIENTVKVLRNVQIARYRRRPENRDRESRRRYAGARSEVADRSGGTRFRRLLSRLR